MTAGGERRHRVQWPLTWVSHACSPVAHSQVEAQSPNSVRLSATSIATEKQEYTLIIIFIL